MIFSEQKNGEPGTIAVKHLHALDITGDDGTVYYGADQLWYKNIWCKKAGCGPTTCAMVLWYLSRTRSSCETLCRYDASCQNGFSHLMEEVWKYVTPTVKGLNSTALFVNGVQRYAQHTEVALHCRRLDIPERKTDRPTLEQVADFIGSAIADDLPVAFLNLSNGAVENLDKWHWVTIVATERSGHTVMVYDQGKKKSIDIKLWLDTTTKNGGFVAVEPVL